MQPFENQKPFKIPNLTNNLWAIMHKSQLNKGVRDTPTSIRVLHPYPRFELME